MKPFTESSTGGKFRLRDQLLTQVGRILELNGLAVVTPELVEPV
jgi:hypothetical protein